MASTRIPAYELASKLNDWMQIPTKRESRNFLDTHPVLLSDEAETLLAQLAQFRPEDDTRAIVEEYCKLLYRCREVGIIRAYAEKTHFPPRPKTISNLPFILDHFLGLMTWAEAQQFLEQHPELLSENADILLQEWAESEEDAELQAFFNRTRTLLRRCQEIGIGPAFDEQQADINAELSPELTAILDKLDQLSQSPQELPQYIELCQQALILFNRADHPQLWALLQNNLGVGYSQSPQGNRKDNLERAVHHCKQALEVRTRQDASEDWAQTQNNLANVFINRLGGNRKDNLEQAIFHYQQALEVYTRQDFPEGWAMVQNNLGNAFVYRIVGERATNIEQAVLHCQQALKVYTQKDFPEGWAMVQHNLGNALFARQTGNRKNNLEQAIAHFNQALQVRTYQDFPAEWAMIQNNIGEVYRERIAGNRAENIEKAIGHYHQALKVFTQQDFPDNWAMTHHNLVNAFLFRITGNRADNLEQALSYCQKALEVYTRQGYPEYWANIQQDLANVYSQRIVGERAANLEKAIYHYNQALEIKTEKNFPTSWALTQHNLASAYRSRISGNRAENLERALSHCHQALKIYTRQDFPDDWAMTQGTLANIFLFRIVGEHRDNLEQAIFHNKQALEIYTSTDYPLNWAAIQLNLGAVYRNRIKGDKAANVEQAIEHLNQARRIYTPQDFPDDWAMVEFNLANAFLFRIAGDRVGNLEQALHHSQQALEVFTREAYPESWAKTQHNLASIFLFRITGQRDENIEQAIIHCEQALSVLTKSAFPIEHASAHHNLAIASFERLVGDRADNLEQSIFHSNRALEIYTPTDFPHDWAMVQNNLASAYFSRIGGKRAENLEKAIFHYEQALTVHTREAYPEHWAQIQNNLAEAYRNRLQGDQEKNFEQAIHHLQWATEVYTRQAFPDRWAAIQTNLGSVFLNRRSGNRADNIEEGIRLFQNAMEVYTRQAFPEKWAIIQINLGEAYHNHVSGELQENLGRAIKYYQQALTVFRPALFPNNCRRAARNLGNLYFNDRNWPEAHQAFQQAIEANERLFAGSFTEVGRQAEVKETSRLYTRTAYCLLQMEQLAPSIQLLEQGKTRLLAEAMALEDLSLAALPDEKQRPINELRQRIDTLEAQMRLSFDAPGRLSNAELGQLLRKARYDLDQLISAIGNDQPDFMPTGLDLPGLLALVPDGGALIAPLITSQGGAVFFLPSGAKTVTGDHVIRLDKFDEDILQSLLLGTGDESGWQSAYNNHKGEGFQTWLEIIETITEILWRTLMGPVHEQLHILGLNPGAPVIIIPQGGLGVFPLHAAWRQVNGAKRTFMEDYTVFYIPSGYVLNVSRRRLAEKPRHHKELLNVINPTGDLFYAALENEFIVGFFDSAKQQILMEKQASRKAVIQEVAGRNYVHFACHGVYDWQDIRQSRLVMAEQSLTLIDIISNLNLSTSRLVTLSACETGLTESQITPEEYIGLPAGLLQAGAPVVIASLWGVTDLSTAFLIGRFYQNHIQIGMSVAEALCQAQLWLRNASQAEILPVLQTYVRQLVSSGKKTEAQKIRREMAYIKKMDNRPFAHPYYWAAFHVVGDAFRNNLELNR